MAKTRSGIAGINDPTGGGRCYLFAIAINEYKAESGYERLNNPVLDSTKLSEVLVNKYGFEPICPPLFNGEATRGGILDKLDEIALEPGDSLIVTFSGHGDIMNEEGQWAAFDSKSGSRSSHVSASDIMDRLDKLVQARHIFLVVDCCFPGGIFKSKYLSQGIPEDHGDSEKSRQVLASGRNKPVPDGAPGEHSPFARELIALLEKNSRPLNVNQLLIDLRRKFQGTAQTPSLDSLKLAAHEGGDFELVPKDFSFDLPDIEELARAFYEIKFPNGWWDELEAKPPKQFNIFALQGKPFSGHLLAAKRFVKLFLAESAHFECYAFSFGANTLAVSGLWEEFGRQYNMATAARAQIVKAIYEKTLDKICVFFVEIPAGSQFPGIEGVIGEFWEEFQSSVKDISTQLESGQGNAARPNPFFLFLMDKRGVPDAAYHLRVQEPFANTVSPNPIPDFTIPVLNFWYARYQQNDLVFRGRFRELDFGNFDAARGDFSAENTILKICEHCEFEKDSSPYQRIFYKHDEI